MNGKRGSCRHQKYLFRILPLKGLIIPAQFSKKMNFFLKKILSNCQNLRASIMGLSGGRNYYQRTIKRFDTRKVKPEKIMAKLFFSKAPILILSLF